MQFIIKGLEKALKESIVGKRHSTNPLSMFSEDSALVDDDLSENGLIAGATNELKKTNREKLDALEKKVFLLNIL